MNGGSGNPGPRSISSRQTALPIPLTTVGTVDHATRLATRGGSVADESRFTAEPNEAMRASRDDVYQLAVTTTPDSGAMVNEWSTGPDFVRLNVSSSGCGIGECR
jgi:hypothetical protein